MRMCRLLEAGAQGIMYPRCERRRSAGSGAVAKFAPVGERGVDAANATRPLLHAAQELPRNRKQRDAGDRSD